MCAVLYGVEPNYRVRSNKKNTPELLVSCLLVIYLRRNRETFKVSHWQENMKSIHHALISTVAGEDPLIGLRGGWEEALTSGQTFIWTSSVSGVSRQLSLRQQEAGASHSSRNLTVSRLCMSVFHSSLLSSWTSCNVDWEPKQSHQAEYKDTGGAGTRPSQHLMLPPASRSTGNSEGCDSTRSLDA